MKKLRKKIKNNQLISFYNYFIIFVKSGGKWLKTVTKPNSSTLNNPPLEGG